PCTTHIGYTACLILNSSNSRYLAIINKNKKEKTIEFIDMTGLQNIICKYLDNIYPIVKDNQDMKNLFETTILEESLEAITGLPF
ncbi:hypothetical protein ABH062_21570, partial [Bacteroides thetaiotaomicron]